MVNSKVTLKDIDVAAVIDLLGTDVVAVKGPLGRRIESVGSLSAATSGMLTFCRYDDERLDRALACDAAAVIVPVGCPIESGDGAPCLIIVRNPRLSFIKVCRAFFGNVVVPGIHPTAVLDPTASVHPGAQVGPYVVIGPRCSIGEGSVVGAHVVLQQDVRVGSNTRIDAGTIIGGEGFGFERDDAGRLVNFPHLGGVNIGDDVDIGSNTCIDRGTLDDTVIGDGARIDNLTHISHNCRIGAHAVVICQVSICGGATVGDYAWVAPSAAVLNQVNVGSRAFVGMGAVVLKDVAKGEVVVGNPARALRPKNGG